MSSALHDAVEYFLHFVGHGKIRGETIWDDKAALFTLGFALLVAWTMLSSLRRRLRRPVHTSIAGAKENETDAVEVYIQWCGGCGFEDNYKAAEKMLLEKYPQRLRIISKRDLDVTGNFEIVVNNYLVHSLKRKRQGFIHNNPAQFEAVCSAIDVAMEELLDESEKEK